MMLDQIVKMDWIAHLGQPLWVPFCTLSWKAAHISRFGSHFEGLHQQNVKSLKIA